MAKQGATMQKKLRVFEKVQTLNLKNEKEFIAMTPAKIVEAYPNITTDELKIILDLQESVSSKTLFTYLCTE